jgi:hypothetical protein
MAQRKSISEDELEPVALEEALADIKQHKDKEFREGMIWLARKGLVIAKRHKVSGRIYYNLNPEMKDVTTEMIDSGHFDH